MAYRTMRHFVVPLGLFALAACADSPTATPPISNPVGSPPALSRSLPLDTLAHQIDSTPQRVEINLADDTLLALQVELKTADELTRDESVRGQVTAISATGDAGTLTLAIGGLQVSFGTATAFRSAWGMMLSQSDFVAQVQAALDAGGPIFVRATRPAPAEPQAPDDASFAASEIRVTDCLTAPKLELNVGSANFALNDPPPPNAYFNVLGLAIAVDSATRIRSDVNHRHEAEVRGLVASVDLTDSTVTLDDGTVIVIVADTRIEDESHRGWGRGGWDRGGWDRGGWEREWDASRLGSLDSVAAAVAAGDSVKAEAEGVVDSTDATRFIAREVEFERVTSDHGRTHRRDCATLAQYSGTVDSVSVGDNTFVLGDGTIVKLTDRTVILSWGTISNLQAVADSLAAGSTVTAQGVAVVDSVGPPALLMAVTVKWVTGQGSD
jgi:hypothetical protein